MWDVHVGRMENVGLLGHTFGTHGRAVDTYTISTP